MPISLKGDNGQPLGQEPSEELLFFYTFTAVCLTYSEPPVFKGCSLTSVDMCMCTPEAMATPGREEHTHRPGVPVSSCLSGTLLSPLPSSQPLTSFRRRGHTFSFLDFPVNGITV